MLRLEVPAAAKHTVELGPAPRGLHGVPAHPPHQPHHYQHRCRQPLRTHTATATAASSTEACSRSDGPRGRTWPHVQHYIGRGVYHSGCDRRFIVPKRSRRAAPNKWDAEVVNRPTTSPRCPTPTTSGKSVRVPKIITTLVPVWLSSLEELQVPRRADPPPPCRAQWTRTTCPRRWLGRRRSPCPSTRSTCPSGALRDPASQTPQRVG